MVENVFSCYTYVFGNVYPLIVVQGLQNILLNQLLIDWNYKFITYGCTVLWNLTCTVHTVR